MAVYILGWSTIYCCVTSTQQYFSYVNDGSKFTYNKCICIFVQGLIKITRNNIPDLIYTATAPYVCLSLAPTNTISGVIVSMLASIAVDREFVPRSSKTKDNEIVICCFLL